MVSVVMRVLPGTLLTENWSMSHLPHWSGGRRWDFSMLRQCRPSRRRWRCLRPSGKPAESESVWALRNLLRVLSAAAANLLREEPMRVADCKRLRYECVLQPVAAPESATCDRLLNLAKQGMHSAAGDNRREKRCKRVTPDEPGRSRQTGKVRSCHGQPIDRSYAHVPALTGIESPWPVLSSGNALLCERAARASVKNEL